MLECWQVLLGVGTGTAGPCHGGDTAHRPAAPHRRRSRTAAASLRRGVMPSMDAGKSLRALILMITTVTNFDIYLHCLERKKGCCLRLDMENQSFT